jgi:hypothetical protein
LDETTLLAGNTLRRWAEQLEDGIPINGLFCKTPVTSSEEGIISHKAKETNCTDYAYDSSTLIDR